MVNEHKAHASFMFKIINVFVSFGFNLILGILIYDIFFNIDENLVVACILIAMPIIAFLILILTGGVHKELTYLQIYDKYKLMCEFIREITISTITSELATIATMILYQLQNPIKTITFLLLLIAFLAFGLIFTKLLIDAYFITLKS